MHILFATAAEPALCEAIAGWVAERLWPGQGRHFGPCTAMGVFERGEIIAAIIYHNHDPDAGVIEYSGAASSARWLARPVLKAMFGYAFETLRCQMVVCRTSEHNHRLHRQLRAFGHSEYRIPRLRGPSEAEIIFTLTAEGWRSNGFHRSK